MTDFLDEKRREITARLKELQPAVDEYKRLEAAASALATRAVDYGVRVAPGSRFSANGGLERRMRLPFTQPPERLSDAVRRLAAAEDSLGRRTRMESGRDRETEVPARWVA